MPAHHKLEAYLDEYIRAAGIGAEPRSPFRSARGRTGELTAESMNQVDAWRMIQRRASERGLKVRIGCHTFRATGFTAYLEAGGTLENAQAMGGTKVRAPLSSTTAPAMKSRLMKSSGLRSEQHVRLLRCTGRTRSHSGFNPTMATKCAQTLLFRFPTEALP